MRKRWICFLFVLIFLCSFAVPAVAAGTNTGGSAMDYIVDVADLLDYDQRTRLEQQAARISNQFGCGVYVVTVEDYQNYGTGSVFDVTTQIYHDKANGFGVGSGRDGILLLLSMDERDYAMFVYGEKANYAFSSYAQVLLEEEFLDDLGENDWYGGFSDYLNTCREFLAKAEAGEPVRRSPTIFVVCSVGASVLIAFIVCMVLKQQMNTVHHKTEASQYVVSPLNLTGQRDQFTHMTQTSRKIESSGSSSGGSSRSEIGGGGTGRSGKF